MNGGADTSFCSVYCGVGASAAFFVTSALQVAGFGSLLTVGFRCVKQAPLWVQKLGFSYGFGIILAIVVCVRPPASFSRCSLLTFSLQGPASGGHLSPCYTLAFWLFKGTSSLRSLPVPFLTALARLPCEESTLLHRRSNFWSLPRRTSRLWRVQAGELLSPPSSSTVLTIESSATRRDHSCTRSRRRSRRHLHSSRRTFSSSTSPKEPLLIRPLRSLLESLLSPSTRAKTYPTSSSTSSSPTSSSPSLSSPSSTRATSLSNSPAHRSSSVSSVPFLLPHLARAFADAVRRPTW